MTAGLHFGLGRLPLLSNATTRSISAENPTGEKGRGGTRVPNPEDPDLPHSAAAVDLGQGWKVRPFQPLPAGQTVTLMDVTGPGIIQHIWMAMAAGPDIRRFGRANVLRFYWEGEDKPSVEVPFSDFFAIGHDLFAPVNSLAVTVNPRSAMNCYWPMPFRKHAKVTITNETHEDLNLGFQITYAETEVPDEAGCFHAQWRRAVTDRRNPDYVILDSVKGQGRYVGTFLA